MCSKHCFEITVFRKLEVQLHYFLLYLISTVRCMCPDAPSHFSSRASEKSEHMVAIGARQKRVNTFFVVMPYEVVALADLGAFANKSLSQN